MKLGRLLVAALMCALSFSIATAAEKLLLSNNVKPGRFTRDFPAGTVVHPTEMRVDWVTEGAFATDPESLKTGKGNALFDGDAGRSWKSRTYSTWSGGQWVTVDIDLASKYVVSEVDVWALHEETRDTDSIQVLFSSDGRDYVPQANAAMPDVPKQKGHFVQIPLKFREPVFAQYLQLRIHRLKSARQQQIGEIAIWGSLPAQDVVYLEAGTRPKVSFSVQTVQAGVAVLRWAEFKMVATAVKQWRVYVGDQPFNDITEGEATCLKKVDGKQERALVFPLTPGQTYYLGVTAVYEEGEFPQVSPVRCKMPRPLTCGTFGDMVGINHFWGGGSAREKKPERDENAYETVALDLLAETGIKHIRWWVVDPGVYQRCYAKGIGVYTYTHGRNLEQGTALGVYAFAGAGNEPDLTDSPIEKYLGRLTQTYKRKESISPQAVICAPSSGLDDGSIEWLDRFYNLGGKDVFDILDLHTYCKIANGHREPDGYPPGAPEALFDSMRKVRAVLQKHGDQNRPLISTEFGYSEAIPNNPAGRITPLTKAAYLVRGLVIHHALGFQRCFLYSFFDEGSDRNYTEHTFGLIDYNLQTKPAYHAVKTVIDVLGDCELTGNVAGIEAPSFGYHYRDAESDRNVYVLWDGTGTKQGRCQTASESITTTGLLGEEKTIVPEADGSFTVEIGPSPAYIRASKPVIFAASPADLARPQDSR